jgi:Flp pilus assembly protein CpaB
MPQLGREDTVGAIDDLKAITVKAILAKAAVSITVAIAMGAVAAYMASNWIAQRAVTVRVDDALRQVAGFVRPGDWVDVVLIRTGPSGQYVSDVLLQDVKVLAIDELANERHEPLANANAVTLELDTDQAQKVLLATDVGKLALVLVRLGEAKKRAVTVRIDDVREVVGAERPDDLVDVVLIRKYSLLGADFGYVAAEYVKVLAIDELVSARRTRTGAKVVTLELDTDQAQKVLLATNVGKLSLMPRR